ncbi:hypothetical protein BDE02_13G122200 [Populus trichocarpa]|jgi:histone deacetylase 1/2|nr:hypothetical protein BDE02_13G122200 [Populus trichocarpa]
MHALTDSLWAAVKRIMRYLKGTTTHDLHITCSSSFALHGFTDADGTNSIDDRKSTSDYLVFFDKTPISCKTGKQHTIARYSIEVESKTLVDDTAEVI